MKRNRRGLTLTEILIVVAIIILLVSLVFVVFRPMQALGRQTNAMVALREMASGFSAYAVDNRQQILPGYLEPYFGDDPVDPIDQGGLGVRVRHRDLMLENVANDYYAAARSFVWRLAPYLADSWQTCYADAPGSNIIDQMASAYSAGNLHMIAESPTFGMNSIFVGGDSRHGGTDMVDRNPWYGTDPVAVTRMSRIRHPGRLIVFGPAAPVGSGAIDSPGNTYARTDIGYPELRAPYLDLSDCGSNLPPQSQQWRVGEAGHMYRAGNGEYANGAGIPVSRSGRSGIPVALADGSAEVFELLTLAGTATRSGVEVAYDCSRWMNDASRVVATGTTVGDTTDWYAHLAVDLPATTPVAMGSAATLQQWLSGWK